MPNSDTSKNLAPAWAERENAPELMKITLGHYATHRQSIIRRLELACIATQKEKKQKAVAQEKAVLKKIILFFSLSFSQNRYKKDTLWSEMITKFSQETLMEKDLFDIEALFSEMPYDVKAHFIKLQKKDRKLKIYSKKLNTKDYHNAKKRIARVQNEPNPLSDSKAPDGLLALAKGILTEE